ncbi:predicted protein [Lichtheimia corymbifera JMRC:FSU:9682]|uniref:Uncharacterized protein n=1 Tax=Lichtheimia corymbifera JMRC:FSU:9682 TaxID=1263082 RepID=A0A068S4T0_9FUNG|nr:predicted protein [Lichtheimia corymbifera JMRC:FSU:9682]
MTKRPWRVTACLPEYLVVTHDVCEIEPYHLCLLLGYGYLPIWIGTLAAFTTILHVMQQPKSFTNSSTTKRTSVEPSIESTRSSGYCNA